jgi:hypothetical protein
MYVEMAEVPADIRFYKKKEKADYLPGIDQLIYFSVSEVKFV